MTGLAASLFCLALAACASDGAMTQRVEALQEEVDRVQSRADRLEERLTALEVGRQKQTLHVDEGGDVSVQARPELKVVKVSPGSDAARAKRPEGEPATEEAKEQEPRPVIRASGAGEGRIENLETNSSDRSTPQRRPPQNPKSEGGS